MNMTNEGLKAVNEGSSSGLSGQVADIYNRLGIAWWVEIKTSIPECVYYFGPFVTSAEANRAMPGYISDLEQEQAQGIESAVRRMKPTQLTIDSDTSDP